MTSKRQIAANRRNAKLSTGPKTSAGKGVSRRNATKHNLAAITLRQADSVDHELAMALAAESATGDLLQGTAVAEATAELYWVRRVVTTMLDSIEEVELVSETALRAPRTITFLARIY